MIRLVVAIILLSIPAPELVAPGICPEDLQGMPPIRAIGEHLHALHGDTAAALSKPQSHSNQADLPFEEDCFCCCHHIVPQLVFAPSEREICARVIPEAVQDVPSRATDPPYHPPRFS
jgi:hypothetical protein